MYIYIYIRFTYNVSLFFFYNWYILTHAGCRRTGGWAARVQPKKGWGLRGHNTHMDWPRTFQKQFWQNIQCSENPLEEIASILSWNMLWTNPTRSDQRIFLAKVALSQVSSGSPGHGIFQYMAKQDSKLVGHWGPDCLRQFPLFNKF